MQRVTRFRPTAVTVALGAVLICVAVMGVGWAEQTTTERWPPQFPREGATKLFENDHVIVWEQIGRPAEPFAHRHIRDILTFAVESGKVEVSLPEGVPPAGRSFTQQIYSRDSHSVSYSRAGLGPHIETAPDPDDLPISIFVEIKGTEPADCALWSTACR